jgi:hypothetical protein
MPAQLNFYWITPSQPISFVSKGFYKIHLYLKLRSRFNFQRECVSKWDDYQGLASTECLPPFRVNEGAAGPPAAMSRGCQPNAVHRIVNYFETEKLLESTTTL